jgi:hypothetical protein
MKFGKVKKKCLIILILLAANERETCAAFPIREGREGLPLPQKKLHFLRKF